MQNFADNEDSINWLEKSISDKYIKYYEYSDFKIIDRIGNGSFGSVFCANWKETDNILALKSFNNQASTLKEVVDEV
jgi:hypothetical protein